jgi:hypothetical protein
VSLRDSARVAEAAGTIDYDGAPFANPVFTQCGGDLRLNGVNQGAYSFAETITYGANCVNRGRVDLTRRQDGDLDYAWYGPAGVLSSTGLLKRAP